MTFTQKKSSLAALFLASAALLTSCGKDDDHHHPAHDQELITTLRLNLTNQIDSTITHSITFQDLDGLGGQNGMLIPDSLRLEPNSVYKASLEVLNESDANNVEDIAEEIRNESASHQFFYQPSQGLTLTVSDLDHDTNHLPLGLEATIATGSASKGNLRISLNHFDGVTKDGITPSGETDIEVSFPVSIGQ